MARRPDEDPRVTDLRRYKKAREQAKRRPPPRPPSRREGFLGSNPRAGLILAVVAVVLLALWVLPALL
jgi:hypothetical protein